MLKIDELEIYNKLTSGASVKGLAKIYGCSRTKIQKIKDNGKYYIDMATGELIFTAKTVTIIEQAFHNLETNLILYDNLGDRKSGLLRDRAVVPRLASFLMSYFNMEITEKSKDSFISKLRDWKAKKIKLVGCDTLGNINQQINDITLDFINNEKWVKPPRKTVVSIKPIKEEKQEVAYSFGMEDYADVYNTVEEVIDEFISTTLWNHYDDKEREKLIFRDYNNNTCIVVDVNTVVPYEDYISADTIVEKLKEDAYEQYERAEEYLDDIDIELLQEELDKLWKKFKKKQGINAPFYTTKETVPYVVTFKDDEVISYKKL